MEERNQYVEMDGKFFESDTHEWFKDNSSTTYAQTDNGLNHDALSHINAFVLRNKVTGEYDRVVMDSTTNQIIYGSKSLEEIAFFIDTLKIQKRFN